MPVLTEDSIYKIVRGILRAAGAPEDHAGIVARHLADANLMGHDSHGFIRTIQYVREIGEGRLDPEASPEVVKETTGSAYVNGHGGFGQVVATFATRLAVEKARQCGIGLVTMGSLGHTGRIGTYPEMAAREGMAAIMFTGFLGGKIGNNVAPFGGGERRLGTNPIAMGFPSSDGGRILLDFATSMVAEGKLRVHRAAGKRLPDGWIIDKEGVPSTDPNDYYEGGAILPMGGLSGGHKGYALGFMVALFGGLLGGLGAGGGEAAKVGGSSIIVIDVAAVGDIDSVGTEVEEAVRWVKKARPMEGSSGVQYPGEIEERTRQDRLANGVSIEQSTWDQVAELVKKHGLEDELGPLP
jgi:uncharacterized oxidoreductase